MSRPGRMWLKVPALVGGLLLPHAAGAQVYHWVDDEGTIHYETGIERVPERYRARARELLESPRPAPDTTPASPRTTTIPFTPGAPILVGARINGLGPITLILDTGADRTMISPAALARLGVPLAAPVGAVVKGVTGTSHAPIVWIDSVQVGSAVSGALPIVAHDADLKDADGLLGRDFLSLFTVTIDHSTSVLTLTGGN